MKKYNIELRNLLISKPKVKCNKNKLIFLKDVFN